LLHLRVFGAISAVPPQKLGGYVGAPERVGHPADASLATRWRRRHCILPARLARFQDVQHRRVFGLAIARRLRSIMRVAARPGQTENTKPD